MKPSFNELAAVTVTLNPAIDRTVTIPNFAAGQVNRVAQVRSNPGGKGVNVAAALADHGHWVAATGFLGRENSSSFESMFAEKHIDDHFVRIAGQTRVGIKITDPIRKETTDINFPGPAPAEADLQALRAHLENLSSLEGAWFVLAGSLPPGVAPDIYREFTETLKARRCKVILDTSGEPLRHALEAAPNIVKPNIHELAAHFGEPLSDQAAVIRAGRKLIARGVEMAVVSMGKDGACFITANEVIIARSPDVEVQSTVGAGDAMVAGIVAAQLAQLPMEECARLASAFSLDALTRPPSGRSTPATIAAAAATITIHRPSQPSSGI